MSLESTHASLHGVSDDKPYRCEMCGNHFLTGECAPAQQVIGYVARVRQSGHACILILNCPPPYTHTVAKLQKHFDQLHTRELKKRTKGRGVKGKKGVDARLRRYGGEEKLGCASLSSPILKSVVPTPFGMMCTSLSLDKRGRMDFFK